MQTHSMRHYQQYAILSPIFHRCNLYVLITLSLYFADLGVEIYLKQGLMERLRE